MRGLAGLLLMFLAFVTPLCASEADIVNVKVVKQGDNVYRFDVSVRHADRGWAHYADGWEVLGPDGTQYGKRTLHHPHDQEQPFTRSLSGVKIPSKISTVTIRAHDNVHKTGGVEMQVRLPK